LVGSEEGSAVGAAVGSVVGAAVGSFVGENSLVVGSRMLLISVNFFNRLAGVWSVDRYFSIHDESMTRLFE